MKREEDDDDDDQRHTMAHLFVVKVSFSRRGTLPINFLSATFHYQGHDIYIYMCTYILFILQLHVIIYYMTYYNHV